MVGNVHGDLYIYKGKDSRPWLTAADLGMVCDATISHARHLLTTESVADTILLITSFLFSFLDYYRPVECSATQPITELIEDVVLWLNVGEHCVLGSSKLTQLILHFYFILVTSVLWVILQLYKS